MRYHSKMFVATIFIILTIPLFAQDSATLDLRGQVELDRPANYFFHDKFKYPGEGKNFIQLGAALGWTNRALFQQPRRFGKTIDDGSDRKMRQKIIEYESWDGTQWVINRRTTLTNDLNGNWIGYLVETWDGTQWLNDRRYTRTYDVIGNLIVDFSERWDDFGSVTGTKFTLAYDLNGNITQLLIESWDGTELVNDRMATYSYDVNGNETETLFKIWDSSQWVNDRRSTNSYDGSGKEIEELIESWDGTLWVSSLRYSFTYDVNGNRTLYQYEHWGETQWVGDWRYTYAYNANGDIILSQNELWDGTQWVINYRLTLTYDINGHDTGSLKADWNGTEWLNNDRQTITYIWFENTVSLIYPPQLPSQYALHPAYPNPFNPATTIQLDLPAAGYVSMVIYDMTGREVTRLVDGSMQAGYHTVRWNGRGKDGSTVATGIYIARLVTSGYAKSIKLVLMK